MQPALHRDVLSVWDWQKEERLADVKVCEHACCGATASASRVEMSPLSRGLCRRRSPLQDPFSRSPWAPPLTPYSRGLVGFLLLFTASVRISRPPPFTATTLLIRSITPVVTFSLTYLLCSFHHPQILRSPFMHVLRKYWRGGDK